MNDPEHRPFNTTTLRDALAKRAFYDMMVREGRSSDREMADAWASPYFDSHKQVAFRLADDFLDTAERWIDRTSDGKLSTARSLQIPTK